MMLDKDAERLMAQKPRDQEETKKFAADDAYHYYGSPIWYTRIGHAAGGAMLELLENHSSLSLHRETLKQWQDTLGDVQDFLVMARLAEELELPTALRQDFLRRAEEQARYCVTQRDILAQFLQNIDDQVRASL